MAHGFSANRDDGLPGYAEAFCDAGFVVVLFDYRHFGASTGEPRQLLDIARQHDDYRAVIDWARPRALNCATTRTATSTFITIRRPGPTRLRSCSARSRGWLLSRESSFLLGGQLAVVKASASTGTTSSRCHGRAPPSRSSCSI